MGFEREADSDFEKLKMGLDCYQGNIVIADNDGRIIFLNEYARKLYKLTSDEAKNMKIHDLVARGIIDRSVCVEAFETKATAIGCLKTASGIELDSVGMPVLTENGELLVAAAYSYDGNFMKALMKQIENEKQKNKNIKQKLTYLQEANNKHKSIILADEQMRNLYDDVKQLAKTESTILIYGESGTGKDVMANFIHRNCSRHSEVFIPINCGAIPGELMEAEFFGYEKGAFTGANKEGKAGIFEMADKGTLFLDEIGDLPLHLQAKLLRVLESGEIKRVGGSKPAFVDVKVIAATNKDLKTMVEKKLFREDLYYRLNVIPITIPPLRQRPGDVAELARYFVEEYNKKYEGELIITADIINKLTAYSWPGNIRELRNEVERMVILSKTNSNFMGGAHSLRTKQADQETTVQPASFAGIPGIDYKGTLKAAVKVFEKSFIKTVLSECQGKVAAAAKRLGVHRSVLYKKIGEDRPE